MATKPNTTSETTEIQLPDVTKLNKLLAAVSSLDEAYVSVTVSAFRNLCEQMSEHSTDVLDYYNEVNKATNKGKRGAKNITFEAFYRAVSAACVTVEKPVPERRGTRFAYVFASQGNTDRMRTKFLAVAGLNGEYGVSIEDYIRFLGVESDWTQSGALTSEAQSRRASAQADREAAASLKTAAAKTRSLPFIDWSGLIPKDVAASKPAEVAAFMLQMEQDLHVWVASQIKGLELTGPQNKAAQNKAAAKIKAAAKAS